MGHLATVEHVRARTAESIETAEELALADAMLLEASAWVRHHGGMAWPTMDVAPELAVAITAAAAARGYLNPGGFDMERSDMSTFDRHPEYAAGTQLSKSEIAMLKPFNRRGGVVSVGLSNSDRPRPRHGSRLSDEDRGYAATAYGGKPIPLGTWP